LALALAIALLAKQLAQKQRWQHNAIARFWQSKQKSEGKRAVKLKASKLYNESKQVIK
jgi:hypothetical protein